jgi:hypothetical protein
MKGDKDIYYKKLPSNEIALKFKKLYDKVIISDWKKHAFNFSNDILYIYTDGSAINIKKIFPKKYKRDTFITGYGAICTKTLTRISKLYGNDGIGTIN